MSISNFLSIHIGKFRLSLLGVINGGMGICWFDKPKKNNHRFVLTLKRPALLKKIDSKGFDTFRNREISTGPGAIREKLADLDLQIIIENSLVEWEELGEEG
ncbi:Rpoc1p [Datura stramonium]|uniref:Rpoc1p n=1 Tax=Datura stramonium TaxID=4076 RepID=A0ABS8VKN4_DATST|nr:Rpoc1p [Datura stramonium]